MTHQLTSSALGHIRVLDLTRILAGPWATQTLADLGAEVIKIENPDGGDDTRSWGPPFVGPDPADSGRLSAYFCTANRNKKSLAIDFSTQKGAQLLKQLAAECDVFIENYKVGGLAKYGLDYESLKEINPAIIYCSITGFGQTGPYAARAGYDFIIQAIKTLTAKNTSSHWIEKLGEEKVPCGPINDMQAVFDDPHVIARGAKIEQPHTQGTIPGVASPLRLSKTPATYHSAPPVLGEQTTDVLRDLLKLPESEIKSLLQSGICHSPTEQHHHE